MSSSSSPCPSEVSASTVAPSLSLSQADQQQLSHVLAEGSAGHIKFTVKWKSNVYQISLPPTATLGLLKTQLSIQTSVRAAHQKLLFKTKTKLSDETSLSDITKGVTAVTVLMVGSPTVDDIIAFNNTQVSDDVIDDFDIDYTNINTNNILDDEDIPVATNPKYLAKLVKYSAKLEITYIAPLRSHITKLLVLDLDYTLFDMYNYNINNNHQNTFIDYKQLKRPYTHRFLSEVYQYYEIVIWSQTSWRWLELKLTELGILTHLNYKILFVMDKTVMFRVESKIRKNKRQHITDNNHNNDDISDNTTSTSTTTTNNNNNNNNKRKHYVKPLALIWKHIPKFNMTNTIHIDDLSRNFAMNPLNGLKIKPYKNSILLRNIDRELINLAKYLYLIKSENNLSTLKHDLWEEYVQNSSINNNNINNIPSIDQQPSGYISD